MGCFGWQLTEFLQIHSKQTYNGYRRECEHPSLLYGQLLYHKEEGYYNCSKKSFRVNTSMSKETKSLMFHLVTIQFTPATFAEQNCIASSKSLDCKDSALLTTSESTGVISANSRKLSNTSYIVFPGYFFLPI